MPSKQYSADRVPHVKDLFNSIWFTGRDYLQPACYEWLPNKNTQNTALEVNKDTKLSIYHSSSTKARAKYMLAYSLINDIFWQNRLRNANCECT